MADETTPAARIIDACGKTTEVARLLFLPYKTVHHWRGDKIPPSQLLHLRRELELERKVVPPELEAAIQALPPEPAGTRAAPESAAA